MAALAVLDTVAEVSVPRSDRIEHAAQLSDFSVKLTAALGVAVCVNPQMIRDRGDVYAHAPEGGRHLHRYRSLLDAGVHLVAGSDAPASEPSVVGGISAAVTRMTASGGRFVPEERLSLLEAVRMYTSAAASWIGDQRRGVVRRGSIADLAVVSGDWARGMPRHPTVVATILGGRPVHLEPGAGSVLGYSPVNSGSRPSR